MFGKSVFLSMMHAYYDMESQDQFGTLFDGICIKDHPSGLKGKFQVMYFDFSQTVSGLEINSSYAHNKEEDGTHCVMCHPLPYIFPDGMSISLSPPFCR